MSVEAPAVSDKDVRVTQEADADWPAPSGPAEVGGGSGPSQSSSELGAAASADLRRTAEPGAAEGAGGLKGKYEKSTCASTSASSSGSEDEVKRGREPATDEDDEASSSSRGNAEAAAASSAWSAAAESEAAAASSSRGELPTQRTRLKRIDLDMVTRAEVVAVPWDRSTAWSSSSQRTLEDEYVDVHWGCDVQSAGGMHGCDLQAWFASSGADVAAVPWDARGFRQQSFRCWMMEPVLNNRKQRDARQFAERHAYSSARRWPSGRGAERQVVQRQAAQQQGCYGAGPMALIAPCYREASGARLVFGYQGAATAGHAPLVCWPMPERRRQIHKGPAFSGMHSFYADITEMGCQRAKDGRSFTKTRFGGLLSVVTESEIRAGGSVRYLVQFGVGELSSADGVGFVFSTKLPCPRNIQQINSIFVNRAGRICIRNGKHVIRAQQVLKRLEREDTIEMQMDLERQRASFAVWPKRGHAPMSTWFDYGAAFAQLSTKAAAKICRGGYLACVVQNVGVTVNLCS